MVCFRECLCLCVEVPYMCTCVVCAGSVLVQIVFCQLARVSMSWVSN